MKRDELIKSEMLKVTGGGFTARGEVKKPEDSQRGLPALWCMTYSATPNHCAYVGNPSGGAG